VARERSRKSRRIVRHLRVRRTVRGSSERPRLAVFRSLKNVYAQIIDDSLGVTLASASSLDRETRDARDGKPKSEISKNVGALIAKRAREKGVSLVVFDRGGYAYHGRVKTLADAAREGGLIF